MASLVQYGAVMHGNPGNLGIVGVVLSVSYRRRNSKMGPNPPSPPPSSRYPIPRTPRRLQASAAASHLNAVCFLTTARRYNINILLIRRETRDILAVVVLTQTISYTSRVRGR